MDGEINIPSVEDVVGSIGADVDNDGSNGGTGSAVAGEGVVVSGLPAIPSSAKICSDDNGCRAKSTYLYFIDIGPGVGPSPNPLS